jgi:hypothetical protein
MVFWWRAWLLAGKVTSRGNCAGDGFAGAVEVFTSHQVSVTLQVNLAEWTNATVVPSACSRGVVVLLVACSCIRRRYSRGISSIVPISREGAMGSCANKVRS